MKKLALSFLFLCSISCVPSSVYADCKTAKALISASIITGVTLEFVNFIRKEKRYTHISQLMSNYPGYSLAAIGTTAGLAIVYKNALKESIIDPLRNCWK